MIDNEIIRACESMTLALAATAIGGTNDMGRDYESWFRLSNGNWLPAVQSQTGAGVSDIRRAVYAFAKRHSDKCYQIAICDIQKEKGEKVIPQLIAPAGGTCVIFDTQSAK